MTGRRPCRSVPADPVSDLWWTPLRPLADVFDVAGEAVVALGMASTDLLVDLLLPYRPEPEGDHPPAVHTSSVRAG